MSTTTSTLPAGVQSVIATIEGVVAMAMAGSMTGVTKVVEGEIDTLDADIDAKLTALQTALDAKDASNPYVAGVLSLLSKLAEAGQFKLTSPDDLIALMKKIVDDLAKGLGGKTA